MSTMTRCRQCGWPWDIGQDGLCNNCRNLQEHPDETSKRKEFRGIPFHDMKSLDESSRFTSISQYLRENPGKVILVMVDCGPGHSDKGDRYIRGVRAIVPEMEVKIRRPGPVLGTETIGMIYQPPKQP